VEARATSPEPSEQFHAGRFVTEAARARVEELFAAHRRKVEHICGALLRDRHESEDAAQQTFLSAYRALLNGTEPRETEAWLGTIARNECLRRIRDRMREPLPVMEYDLEDNRADVPRQATSNMNAVTIWQEIQALPDQQRDAIVLREFAGLSYEELTVALGVSDAAVESLLFRARGTLRRRLQTALASVNLAGAASGAASACARLFAAGAAPIATKAAVVGAGAVVGGGIFVGGGALTLPTAAQPRHTVQHAQRPHPVHQQTAVPAPVTIAAKTIRIVQPVNRQGELSASREVDGGGSVRRSADASSSGSSEEGQQRSRVPSVTGSDGGGDGGNDGGGVAVDGQDGGSGSSQGGDNTANDGHD
jgi:RNA polymerase sigma-70 factor (ECF subfamily)